MDLPPLWLALMWASAALAGTAVLQLTVDQHRQLHRARARMLMRASVVLALVSWVAFFS